LRFNHSETTVNDILRLKGLRTGSQKPGFFAEKMRYTRRNGQKPGFFAFDE